MSDSNSRFGRRTVLKTLGGAAGAALVGGGGIAAFAGGASAQAAFDLNITGTNVSNDQGDISYVAVDANKTIAWDGYDVPVRYINFKHEITIEDDGDTGWHELYNKNSARLTDWSSEGEGGDGWGGPGEYVSEYTGDKADGLKGTANANIAWAIVSDGSHPAEYDSVQTPIDWTDRLSVAPDGSTETRVLKWKTTLTFLTEGTAGNPAPIDSADGVPEVSSTERFAVTVTNEQSEPDVSTEGSASGV